MSDPHRNAPVRHAGAPLETARAAVVLLHGRGATAEGMLPLADELGFADLAYLAPQAAGRTWYPYSFLAPLEQNEPHLSSALGAVGAVVAAIEAAGKGAGRIALIGFSQGACLALEFAARHARRYGAVIGWTGGLIGPDGAPRDYEGSLDGTPVFLGSSDVDAHVPLARVEESAEILRRLGGEVELRVYKGMAHTVDPDELAWARDLLREL